MPTEMRAKGKKMCECVFCCIKFYHMCMQNSNYKHTCAIIYNNVIIEYSRFLFYFFSNVIKNI